jgi:DNA repair photolyase
MTIEPFAPSPEIRLQSLRELNEYGFNATLLFKPLLLGINEEESQDMINAAIRSKSSNLVIGTFYVNKKIFRELLNAGLDIDKLLKTPIDKNRETDWLQNKAQYQHLHAVQERIISEARSRGLKAFKSTICVVINDLKLECSRNFPFCIRNDIDKQQQDCCPHD